MNCFSREPFLASDVNCLLAKKYLATQVHQVHSHGRPSISMHFHAFVSLRTSLRFRTELTLKEYSKNLRAKASQEKPKSSLICLKAHPSSPSALVQEGSKARSIEFLLRLDINSNCLTLSTCSFVKILLALASLGPLGLMINITMLKMLA